MDTFNDFRPLLNFLFPWLIRNSRWPKSMLRQKLKIFQTPLKTECKEHEEDSQRTASVNTLYSIKRKFQKAERLAQITSGIGVTSTVHFDFKVKTILWQRHQKKWFCNEICNPIFTKCAPILCENWFFLCLPIWQIKNVIMT